MWQLFLAGCVKLFIAFRVSSIHYSIRHFITKQPGMQENFGDFRQIDIHQTRYYLMNTMSTEGEVMANPDTRIQYTKSRLYAALTELLEKKAIGLITVKELCEAAAPSISTIPPRWTCSGSFRRSLPAGICSIDQVGQQIIALLPIGQFHVHRSFRGFCGHYLLTARNLQMCDSDFFRLFAAL